VSERAMSFRERHELYEARAFVRRVRDDFVNRDDPVIGCACNLCWGENWAAVRAMREVVGPGMSEDEIALAVWKWMHEANESPWAWKRREGRRYS
jgi:hypothetical protein